MTEPDPRITPFLSALLDYHGVIKRQIEMLSDDELVQVYDLFSRDNRNLPAEFWSVSFTVRARIRVEQKRRAQLAAPPTTGATAE
jgi:hypothetical protein